MLNKDNQELKQSVKRFYNMLGEFPDEPNIAHEFIAFLRPFLRIKSKQPLPTIEVMTLIRHHKPVVFDELRKMTKKNMMLQILTDLSTDVEMANKKLKSLIK